ncbi:ANTAR domain-containing response regulator [Phyllobacterium bourgognense]|uniref:ANTAR domain-containing protein n=1 Tax=Phyllobacterium bourgognense TaxID=314236 RepID=A0A368YM47_9HYPH|nr:ANTAR domain-containing protein [Phyllobacterium bourgognense]RCW81300.1 ANTAR domain-containing protein [Phyllobacterium bourgognense]
MKTHRLVQNFSGYRALICALPERSTEALAPTLKKLGLQSELIGHSPAAPVVLPFENINADRDILFIDGDMTLPMDWRCLRGAGRSALPPAPVVGLVGIEAPSRLKALLLLGATAFLAKPVYGGAVYSALFLGVNEYNRKEILVDAVDVLYEKRRRRAVVIKAVVSLMNIRNIDEDVAYDLLRKESMRARLSIEDYCEYMLGLRQEQDKNENAHGERQALKG